MIRNRRYVWSMMLCAAIMLPGCEVIGIEDDGDDDDQSKLIVTQRSGSTLSLQWDAMPKSAQGIYTVDYFAFPSCEGLPMHSDVLHVTGLQVQLTGLAPSTTYNIHVHSLPHDGESTNFILVETLESGAPAAAVTPADYEVCAG